VGRAHVLREGTDVTLAAAGVMVAEALEAAEQLADAGVSAEVIDVASVKPLDQETLVSSAAKTGAVVTAEEHSVVGGVGSAIAQLLGEHNPVRIRVVGVRDVFGTSGEPAELMEHFGLTSRDIARAARELLS
jgi:transketolase